MLKKQGSVVSPERQQGISLTLAHVANHQNLLSTFLSLNYNWISIVQISEISFLR